MMYHDRQAVVQVNGRRSGAIAIERSVRQGCTLSPLLYVLTLEPFLYRLRDEGKSPTLRGIPLVGRLAACVSAFADDITVFVSRRLDIEAAKVNAQVGIWLSRRLSLKGRAEACAACVFPLILYRLAVHPLPKAYRLALQRSLSRLLWGGARPMVRRHVCIQRTCNGGLCMPDLESHWLAERLAYLDRVLTGDSVWRRKASWTFPRLNSDPKAEGRRRPLGEALFVCECRKALRNLLGSSDLSCPRKELYRELVVGSASDPLSERHGWTAGEIRSHWN